MNANFYCSQGDWLMVDNGVTFDSAPERVVMTDIRTFIESIDITRLKGLVITHAHEDHVGAVGYLWPYLKCPVYATPFTAYIARHKLKDVGLAKVPVIEVPLDTRVEIGSFGVEFVSLTHSIPEPSAVLIRTKEGNIFHTGDWKHDPNPVIGPAIDQERIKKIGEEGIAALVCDSTNVFESGTSGSEGDVEKSLMALVRQCEGQRVIISCFSSNVARVATCFKIAEETGRKVCLMGTSLKRMVSAAQHCGYLPKDLAAIEPEEIPSLPSGSVMVLTTGSQAEPQAALTRMAEGTHKSLALGENDVVVFSSRVIPGNQKAISALKNRLVLKNVHIVDQKEDIHVSGHPCRDELALMYSWLKPQSLIPVHGEDRHILEHYSFALSQGVPHAVRPHNGQLFQITAKDGPVHVGNVETGRLALDGKRLVEDEGPVMTDRRQLCETGFLVVIATVSPDKKKVLGCRILSRGVFEHADEQKEWETIIRKSISDTLHQLPDHRAPEGGNGRKNSSNQFASSLSEGAERDLYRLFKTNLKIRPIIQVHITWL